MIVLALTSWVKGVTSVTIVANLATKLTDVMPYMVVLLDLLRLLKLPLCNLLPWTILQLIPQANLLFSMNFLKWYEDRQNPSSTASVAHSGTSFVFLTHSTSHGPWVLDSGATDHITDNKSFFSFLSTMGYLPSVTMANGYRVLSHGAGTINLFSSLSIDNVLYVPRSPFNLLSISRLTHSLDCVILPKILLLYSTGVRDG